MALIWNLGFSEIVLIAIVAILIFGKRLPEVASQTFRQVTKLRRNLEDLRRESGIDKELGDVRGALRDLTRDIDAPLPYRGQPTLPDRREPRLVEVEPPAPQPPPPPQDAATPLAATPLAATPLAAPPEAPSEGPPWGEAPAAEASPGT